MMVHDRTVSFLKIGIFNWIISFHCNNSDNYAVVVMILIVIIVAIIYLLLP